MHTAADIARWTLRHLSESGLLPTPENYTRYYHMFLDGAVSVGGERKSTQTVQHDVNEIAGNTQTMELLRSIMSIVTAVSDTTDVLATNINQHNREFKSSLDNLTQADEKEEIMAALNSIVAIAGSLHSRVKASHSELIETKQAFSQFKVELKQCREWLHIDPLTGAQNRRGMDMVLAREVARSRRNATKLSVAMIDVDHFKRINDEFGHVAGDKALVHLTQVIQSVLRETDVLVRYGGEEFLVILSDTEINGALFVLDRLKLLIHKTPMIYEGKRIGLSCSYGLAQFNGNENGEALLVRADNALYQAKKAGRNCIIVSG